MSPGWRIGIDLGGTKIEALALSPDGEEAGRRRMASWFVPATAWRLFVRNMALRLTHIPGVDRIVFKSLTADADM